MNELLLAQAVVESNWSPVMVNLLIVGIILIIGALSAGIVKVIQALNTSDVKLDKIEELVDGRYTSLLKEVAEVRKLLAASTGSPLDKGAAVAATNTAEAQQAVADKVNGKNGHPT